MRVTWQQAVREAARCGFPHAALVPAESVDGYVPNEESARQGIEQDPRTFLPTARSVLVAAMPFAWYSAWPGGHAEVSAFYFQSQKAHEAIRGLEASLRAMGAEVLSEQRLPAKVLAHRAGIGTFGRNSLIRNEQWGSCFTLRLLLTDIEPQEERTCLSAPSCGDCTRCVIACPVGALDGNGQVDVKRCIRAHMLTGEVVPEPLRDAMGTRLLGCEICQRVCPHNAKVSLVPAEPTVFSIEALLTGSRSHLVEIGRQIGWNEARLQRIQSQAAIAAGNTTDARYIPLLEPLAQHTRPSIAEHAQWAIQKILRER